MDTNEGKYKTGIDIRQLIRLPLQPPAVREGLINALDLASTLRGNLRDFLALDVTDRTTPENRAIEKEHEYTLSRIRNAEWELMQSHAMLLSTKEFLLSSISLPPNKDLDVPAEVANEYNLISWHSLFPYLRKDREEAIYERCKETPCEHLYKMRESIEDRKKIKEILEESTRTPRTYVPKDLQKKALLEISPEEVVFDNYVVGTTYTHKLKLQNSGDHSASLKFVMPNDPSFEVDLAKKWTLLAPGLSVEVTVSFHCSDKDDHFDRFMVHSSKGKYLTVPIKAVQVPPCLLSLRDVKSSPILEMTPLKSTIDCGRCFVGCVTLKRIPLYNPGSTGRFFVLSELSWYFNRVKDVTEENVLGLKPFYIQPAHFILRNKKKRKIKVVFSPEWEGSHLVQVFVICDNVTLRSLDILGEAIMFNKELFVIENLEKNYNIFTDEDRTAEYYLYMGRVLSNSTIQKKFFINNASIVETKFHWKVSRADISGVNFLDPVYSSIEPGGGGLCPERRTQFTITYNSCDLPIGKYVAIFSIILEDIPKAALTEEQKMIEPEDSSELMVRVCLGRIEVWLDIEPPNFCLWPSCLYFRNEPSRWSQTKLYVTNYEKEWTMLWWRLPCLHNLMLHPKVTKLPPFSSAVIIVMLKTEMVGKFTGRLSGYFLQSTTANEVLLECETVVSLPSDRNDLKDLGILREGEVKISNIEAAFPITREVDLDINHFSLRYDQDGADFFKWEPSPWLLYIPTKLQPHPPSQVVIKSNTEVEQICVEIIEWKFYDVTTYTTIISDVQALKVVLHPPVLAIKQPLYRGLETFLQVRIINQRTLKTSFRWAGIHGQQNRYCSVCAVPEHGALPPNSQVAVLLFLTPLTKCFLQDFFFQFSIDFSTKPLIGSICGVVKDPEVELSWINDGKNISSRWPQEECNSLHQKFPSLESLPPSDEQSIDKDCEICYSEVFTTGSTSKSVSSEDRMEANIMAYKDSSDTSSIPYLNWPYIGGRYYGAKFTDEIMGKDFEAPWTEESLTDRLKGIQPQERDSFLSRYSEGALCFTVDTFKVYSKTFNITNLSPIPVSYKIKTNRFRVRRKLPPIDPFFKSEIVFYDESLGCKNLPTLEKLKWSQRVKNNLGLAIRVKEKTGTIQPDRIKTVTVSVFAVAWGVYFDDISVFVDNHPPFHVPILVKCDSSPAFFTFAPESKAPLLRFPAIRHKSSRSKTVYLNNECPLPLKIAWTVYSVPMTQEWELDYLLPPNDGADFSLAVELHPNQNSDFCNMKLIPYAGQPDGVSYTVEPPVVYLSPRSKVPVLFTANSSKCWFDVDHPTTQLLATAFGIIYLDDVNMKNEEYFCCYRPDGYDINPISLKLETLIEMLSFRLVNCSKSDAVFKVNTSEIFNSENKQQLISKTYYIENYGKSAANITVRVQPPFLIAAIRHHWGEEIDTCNELTVKSSETIEVEVLLKLNKNILTRRSESRLSILEGGNPIISELNFGQRGDIENIMKLEIHILKPVFEFPTDKLVFGQTCLLETKIKDINIYVRNGDQPFKVHIERNEENIFVVKPSWGIVTEGKPTHLTIKFTPRECRRYINVLQFISSTPGSIYPLYVEGTGSLDHRFYS